MPETELHRILAANLKRERSKVGFSQDQLAEACGVSANFVTEVETRRRYPSPATLVKIAQALNTEPHTLLRDGDDRDLEEVISLLKEIRDQQKLLLDRLQK